MLLQRIDDLRQSGGLPHAFDGMGGTGETGGQRGSEQNTTHG